MSLNLADATYIADAMSRKEEKNNVNESKQAIVYNYRFQHITKFSRYTYRQTYGLVATKLFLKSLFFRCA